MTKKILSLILALAMILPLCPVFELPVFAIEESEFPDDVIIKDEPEKEDPDGYKDPDGSEGSENPDGSDGSEIIGGSGICGENSVWQLDSDGTLYIGGTGNVNQYVGDSWNKDQVKKIIVQEGITELDGDAFASLYNLTTVELPDGLKTIGDFAFSRCEKLNGITIPESVTSIGNFAFSETGISENDDNWNNNILYVDDWAVMLLLAEGETINGDYVIREGTVGLSDMLFVKSTSLTSITLPESLKYVGDDTFNSCVNLTEANLGSKIVTIGDNTFAACNSLESINLPESLTSIGEYAFSGCSSLSEVEIPADVRSIGAFAFNGCRNLTSVLIPGNLESIGYCAFNRCSSVTIYGIGGSITETYANDNGIPFVSMFGNVTNIELILKDANGYSLTDGYTVKWYDANENEIGSGNVLENVEKGGVYYYEIRLGDVLACEYFPIDGLQAVIVGDETKKETVSLERIPDKFVSGNLINEDGSPVKSAEILVVQTFATGATSEQDTYSDSAGCFSLSLKTVPTTVYFFADGYYGRIANLSQAEIEQGTSQLENLVLKSLGNNKITLSITEKSRKEPGEEDQVSTLSSLEGFEITLYNKTKGKTIQSYSVEGMEIYFDPGEAAPFDTLTLTLKHTQGRLESCTEDIYLDELAMASHEIVLTEKGIFRIGAINAKEKSSILLFDKNGKLVCSDIVTSSYESMPLNEGDYTLVALAYLPTLHRTSSLDTFAKLGITEENYYKTEITIQSGEIRSADAVTVPDFDASVLNYTNPENTLFSVAQSSVIIGKYFTMRCQYEIAEKYNATNQKIIIELPEGTEYTQKSLTLDGIPAVFSYEDGKIVVFTSKNAGVIRFYATASEVGDLTAQAYLEASINGADVMQSLGSAVLHSIISEMQVPEKTCKEVVRISGKTVPAGTVTLYDGQAAIGTTTANLAGDWKMDAPLSNAFSYSHHSISAEVTHDTLVRPFKSETVLLLHDESFAEVKKVTMINSQGGYEASVVFDFEDNGSIPSWSYNPSYPNFTFIVEFDGDPEKISNVCLTTTGSSGTPMYLPCTYDPDKKVFIGARSYNSADAPASVSVSYDLDQGEVLVTSEEKILFQNEVVEQELNEFAADISENLVLGEAYDNGDGITLPLFYGPTGDCFTNIGISFVDFSGNVETDGYTKVSYDGYEGYTKVLDFENFTTLFVIPEHAVAMQIKLLPQSSSYKFTFGNVGAAFGSAFALGDTTLLVNEYVHLRGKIEDVWMAYNDREATTRQMLEVKCPDGTRKLSDADYQTATNLIVQFNNSAGDWYNQSWEFLDEYAKLYRSRLSLILSSLAISGLRLVQEQQKVATISQKLLTAYENSEFAKTFGKNTLKNLSYIGMGAYATYEFVTGAGEIDYSKSMPEIAAEITRLGLDTYGAMTDGTYGQDNLINLLSGLQDQHLDDVLCTASFVEQYLLSSYSDSVEELKMVEKFIRSKYKKCEEDPTDPNNPGNPTDPNKPVDPNDPNQPGDSDDPTGSGGSEGADGSGKNGSDDDPGSKPTGENQSPTRKATPIIDPSGYVCEAVPSNRLEGVKVEAYYYDYPLDDFGMPEEEKAEIFWDAEAYSQVNPLYTGQDGRYAWDVPAGQWLVKFSKDGYLPADSRNDPAVDNEGYLPVPPPQTEVNIALVSTALPTVESVNVFDDSVRIEFSQYMDISSVNTNSVKITVGGQNVTGTIRPVNNEASFNDPSVEYASIFDFVPAASITGEANVSVNGVINYAGNAMASTYTTAQQAKLLPTELVVNQSVSVEYNGGALLAIKLDTPEAGAGKEICVESLSPSIVSAMETVVIADAQGQATVMISGNLPGTGMIKISVPGTDLTQNVTVNVAKVEEYNPDRCKKVTADVQTGTLVPHGTVVTLSTETEGAEIYYTLDKSCPCEENNPARLKYEGPFTLTEDVFIIAYAVKEGMEDSLTAGFEYTILPYTPGDVDGVEGVTLDDAIYLLYHVNFKDLYLVNQPVDFNGDGKEDLDDAIYLLYHVNFKDLYPLH